MANNIQFSNNASALLAANINDVEVTISLEIGGGALFPSPSGSQYFMAALQDADGNLEIVRCTARSFDNLTVVRGQEGTSGQSWTAGQTRFELRLTEETMEEMLQKNGGTMTGNLDMDDNSIIDPVITGAGARMVAGQIVGVPIRGAVDDSSNEILVPSDGNRATASGSAVLTQADLNSNGGLNLLPISTIVMWFGTLVSLPTGWQLCDGSNGTPDMRNQFPVGAGDTYASGSSGGSANAAGDTSSNGGHDHGAATGSHVITKSQIPNHTHGGSINTGGAGNGGFDRGGDGNSTGVVFPGHTRHQANSKLDTLGNTTQIEGSPLTTGMLGATIDVDDPAEGHTHSLSTTSTGAHTHTVASVSTIPPYRALYFIMRVS